MIKLNFQQENFELNFYIADINSVRSALLREKRRIQIRTCEEAKKHKVPTDPDPEHWWAVSRRVSAGEAEE